MISANSLKMIRCPESHQSLRLADPGLIAELNQKISQQQLQNKAGQKLTKSLDGGLIRDDEQVLYPILDGIPILLIDDGIVLATAK